MHAQLLNEILPILDRSLNIRADDVQPVNRGLLNEKWKLKANRGRYFVKSYNPERYRKHLSTLWPQLEQALELQMRFHQAGGRCPKLYANEEAGGYLFQTPSGRKFVVMELCDGDMVRPGKANGEQMYSLGLTASQMHGCWSAAADSNMEPIWKPDKPALLSQWETGWEEAKEADTSPFVLEALQLQGEVLRQTEFGPFERAVPGWSHLDLWADNLLFAPDGASAIVDFDRTRYSFPLLDIGRAVLSLALDEGEFCRESAAAFAEGYRKAHPFPKGELLNAVRLVWVMESFWWLRPRMETYSVAPSRFAKEMIWTAKQWDRLEQRLGGI